MTAGPRLKEASFTPNAPPASLKATARPRPRSVTNCASHPADAPPPRTSRPPPNPPPRPRRTSPRSTADPARSRPPAPALRSERPAAPGVGHDVVRTIHHDPHRPVPHEQLLEQRDPTRRARVLADGLQHLREQLRIVDHPTAPTPEPLEELIPGRADVQIRHGCTVLSWPGPWQRPQHRPQHRPRHRPQHRPKDRPPHVSSGGAPALHAHCGPRPPVLACAGLGRVLNTSSSRSSIVTRSCRRCSAIRRWSTTRAPSSSCPGSTRSSIRWQAYGRLRKLEEDYAGVQELMSDPDMREMAREDAVGLEADIEGLDAEIQRLLIPKDPNDSKNVVREIRAGAGEDEAALFASDCGVCTAATQSSAAGAWSPWATPSPPRRVPRDRRAGPRQGCLRHAQV